MMISTMADSPQLQARAEQAQAFCRSFMCSALHAPLFAHLRGALGLSDDDIEQAYVQYAFQSYLSGNEIYATAAIHVAMLIEYLTPGSIHDDRQELVVSQLLRLRPRRIADVGFGAPTRYLSDYVLRDPGVSVLMLDKFAGALEVGRALLGFMTATSSGAASGHFAAPAGPLHGSGAVPGQVQFALHDMDREPCPAGFDCYLFQDAIEHAAEPTRYLHQAVAAASGGAALLFQIPLGPIIPSHYIAWPDAPAAVTWLEAAGLAVEFTRTLVPNPAVDWFAADGASMQNLFVVARKQ